jgi:DNA-binding transcriptional MerR regulator
MPQEGPRMLTISQLATYAGVTVRAVRHYHATKLLPEPSRDHSGYRRYDASAVVELIRIRTLAEAGVPLSRVRDLLTADEEGFATAVDDIDRRLRAEIRERQRARDRIRQLASGDSLALPPEVVSYLDRLRELGVPEHAITMERDAWILVAAQLPEQMPALMAVKRAQVDTPAGLSIYLELVEAAGWEPRDPRVPAFADRLVSLIEEAAGDWERHDPAEHIGLDDDLVALLDAVFLEAVPIAPQLLRRLAERGWTGWTRLERLPPVPDEDVRPPRRGG